MSPHFFRRFIVLAVLPVAALLIFFMPSIPAVAACPASFPVDVPANDPTRLIEVIDCANATTSNDVINLAAGSSYVLSAIHSNFTGLPPIAPVGTGGTLTINGNGATIVRNRFAGTPQFRIITVNPGANLTLNHVTLRNGSIPGFSGGAISNAGTLYLNASTLTANTATGGGALYTAGTVIIRDSVLSGNVAANFGGAIANNSATLHVVNSTISGNFATGTGSLGGGGAIDSYGTAPQLNFINSTVTNNSAATENITRSGIWLEAGSMTLFNSIVANNNGANNCRYTGGSLSSNLQNIDNGTSCGFTGTYGQNTDPLLSPLANYGGLTQTHALLPGSPAINNGNTGAAVNETGVPLTTDQRGSGFARVSSTSVDIGAYEVNCPTFPASIPAGDSAALIEAVGCANATPSNDVINLASASTYTLTLALSGSNGLPAIMTSVTAGTLTINGNGATITRGGIGTPLFRIIAVNPNANLTLNRITLSNGNPGGFNGGAISNAGTLNLNASTLSGNTAHGGGALMNAELAIIRDSTISGNTATNFGGAIVNNSATLRLINSTISGNAANGTGSLGGGGAIDIYGTAPTVQIVNSTIFLNSAVISNRSGIWVETGTVTVQNSIVAGNGFNGNCDVDGGSLFDVGNNLDNGTTCNFGGAWGQNTDPLLEALADNGGLTLTHALRFDSPAINAGSNALAVDHLGAALTTDQRGTGFPRIVNTTVDIGAYEANYQNLVVTLPLQGHGTPPNANHVVTVNVKITVMGQPAPFLDQNFTTNANGVFTISNLSTGTYSILFKGTHTLARRHTITVINGANGYTTSMLLEGDANNDNVVNLVDFSLLAASFGKAQGQTGYDPRADFNGDNVVTLPDFSLLASNFGKPGDV